VTLYLLLGWAAVWYVGIILHNAGVAATVLLALGGALYQRDYRERRGGGGAAPVVASVVADRPQLGPGPVELGVEAEISCLAAEARPGLASAALALARIMDNPRAVATQPAAARQLVVILDQLSKGTHRRGRLAVVRAMSGGDE
jgi:hypothetical protein